MSIKLIKATLVDISLINDLICASKGHWGYDKEFLDHFIQILGITPEYINSSKSITQLAYFGDKLVGLYSFTQDENHNLELDNFFIHPDFIGQGIGRQLWKDVCKTAISFNEYRFILWSDPNSVQFYEKMGCEKIGEKESPMKPNRFISLFKYVIRD